MVKGGKELVGLWDLTAPYRRCGISLSYLPIAQWVALTFTVKEELPVIIGAAVWGVHQWRGKLEVSWPVYVVIQHVLTITVSKVQLYSREIVHS